MPLCKASAVCLYKTTAPLLLNLAAVLIDAELRYSATELEMLAVVHCVEKWHVYVEGREVHIYTDHKPNTFFNTTRMQSRRAARWLEKLQQYQLQWHYKPGPQNVVVDALSRHPVVDMPVVALAVLRSTSRLRKLVDSLLCVCH
jgi:hypothetical protein